MHIIITTKGGVVVVDVDVSSSPPEKLFFVTVKEIEFGRGDESEGLFG